VINIRVFTNEDDDKRIQWPREIQVKPTVGERLLDIDNVNSRVICGITHAYDFIRIEVCRPNLGMYKKD